MKLSVFGCRYGRYILYQKYVVSVMVCLALIIMYGNRYAFGRTSRHVIILKTAKRKRVTEGVCPAALELNHSQLILTDKHIEWSRQEMYYVESAFFISYTAVHIPGGVASDIYGAKHFLSMGILGSGILTIIQPFILIHLEWYYTLINQALCGALQALCIPAGMSLISHWVPTRQLTFLFCVTFSGTCLGSMFSTVVIWVHTHYMKSWQAPYMFWGALACAWYLIFTLTIFSHSSVHPFACAEEKAEIEKELGTMLPRKIPWKPLLTDSAVWALVAGQLGHNNLVFTFDKNLYHFMDRVIGADVDSRPGVVITPYLVLWISMMFSSYFGDYLINKRLIPVLYIRTHLTTAGNLLPSILIVLGTYVGCNKFAVTVLFSLAMIFKGAVYPGMKVNVLDITRHYAGTVSGLHNGIPSITCIINPKIISYMCPNNTICEWRKVFWLFLTIGMFTTTLYNTWSKGERAEWDKCQQEEDTKRRRRTGLKMDKIINLHRV